jgi:MFS family permease
MAASRLVAPYFGSSNAVWANVIGLMLAFLALGYWLGGKVADSRPHPRLLGAILVLAAALLAVVPFAAHPLLRLAVNGFASISIVVVVGSFVSVLALFALPVTLLGAVAPFAVRLNLSSVAAAGQTAGRLYALSTVGSILGTFLAALVAIPLVGTQRTLLATAALIAISALPLLGVGSLAAAAVLAVAVLVPPGQIKPGGDVIYETESPYEYVSVVAYPDGERALQINEGVADQSVWYPHSVLTGGWAAGAFGVRAISNAAALELRPHGIQVTLLIVDAGIRPLDGSTRPGVSPEELADPRRIADAVLFLANQDARSATHELQLTPLAENWTP